MISFLHFLQMAENPWNVDSIQAFLFLKCPECLFDTNVEDDFRDHAVENHPLSYTFFGKQFNVKDIKQENSEEWTDQDLNNFYNCDVTVSENANSIQADSIQIKQEYSDS